MMGISPTQVGLIVAPSKNMLQRFSQEFLEIAQYALLTQIYFPCIVSLQIPWFWKEYWYCIARFVCFPSFVFSDQPVVYLGCCTEPMP